MILLEFLVFGVANVLLSGNGLEGEITCNISGGYQDRMRRKEINIFRLSGRRQAS